MIELLRPLVLAEEVTHLYTIGLPAGSRSGWHSLDMHCTFAPGYWTVITGIPSHGKSTWLDNLTINLMKQGWKFIVYSPEQQPTGLHLSNLCEILLNQSFRYGTTNRMSAAQLAKAMDWLDEKILFMRRPEEDKSFVGLDLNAVMFGAQDAVEKVWGSHPKIGVVIDPWNELDHSSLNGMNETQFINHELMVWRNWIRMMKRVHGFIVAHPAKPQKDKDGNYKPVGLYDINGSAAWKNKCDLGIVVRREDSDDPRLVRTMIDVEKVRYRHHGKAGFSYLKFNSGTNTFLDQNREQRYIDNEPDVDDS
jgi:twinkle protein